MDGKHTARGFVYFVWPIWDSFMGKCKGIVIFYCNVDLWGKSTLYKVSDVGLGVVLLVDIFDQKRENT